mgnify:CR=1 FL=1|jgi:hypothetical protein|tara:strand:- start:226 stop:513 length:288 start_codon:yes stop_codon:yes gene_type:complete
MFDYSKEEVFTEASNWFSTYAGTYARLLERTEENINKAFWVFCELMLGQHPEDVSDENIYVFENAFKSSSYVSDITPKQLVAGAVEFNEIIELIY